jgi:hypothetical protein
MARRSQFPVSRAPAAPPPEIGAAPHSGQTVDEFTRHGVDIFWRLGLDRFERFHPLFQLVALIALVA